MLHALSNFWSIITAKMIKRNPSLDDLIALGTKDKNFGGGYKATAITVADFIASLPGGAVMTDGVTIGGTGTSNSPLYAIGGGSGTVNYVNVIFVDPIYGNDATGIAGDFTKPFLTPSAAAQIANGITRTVTNRVLIWIRKGEYLNGSFNPFTNMDVYCEPGVVFTGSFLLNDQNTGTASPTNFNFYGYAQFNVAQSLYMFRWQYASTVFIQGNSIVNTGAIGLSYNVTSGTSNVTYDFNSIESTQTLGSGYTFTWRNNCNGTVNVKNYIKSPHTHHDIRLTHSGTVNVNCPNNILTATNVFGGNFKQIIYVTSALSTSIINIKGNLVNEGVTYLGGLEAMILSLAGSSLITLNGNIATPAGIAVSGRSSEIIVVNGNVTAGIYVANQLTGAGEAYFNGGAYQNTTANPVFLLSASQKLFIRNASIYNNVDVTSTVDVLSNTSKLYMYNCIAGRNGTVGYLVYGGVTGIVTQLHNIRSVGALHVNVTDQLVPTGLIVDLLLTVPKY
jgi:hypothetical protein